MSIEDLAGGASELVRLLAVEAGEEELAVSGVGVNGVLLKEPVRSDLA